HLVNRFLKKSEIVFLQRFQTVTSSGPPLSQWLVPQKWCAFYSPQENCQRPISVYFPELRYPPIRPVKR
ncbi:MAG: hypothetical protein R6W86_05040, partial [Marinobacter sp.]|uniref:hypothetical protein n=1 Tax=Marinobacter sp. TaxID=50741 RepID=UPI00396D53B0